MALDPSIFKNIQPQIDPQQSGQNVLRSAQLFQNIKDQQTEQERKAALAPFKQQAFEAQAKAAQRDIDVQDIRFLAQGVDNLKALKLEQRPQALGLMRDRLAAMGIDISKLTPSDLTDESLSAYRASLPNIQQHRKSGIKTSAPFEVIDSDGTRQQAVIETDPNTGEVVQRIIRSPEGVSLASETAQEKRARDRVSKVTQKRDETKVQLEEKIRLGGKAAGVVKAGEQAIKESGAAFERLEPLALGLSHFDEAIQLIDDGAKTGVILSRLPSIRKQSIQLDNLQKKMGLDVIAGTTFGALSEGEREFALSSALPKNLSPPDLRRWLERKRAAQQKLIDELTEAAVFLGTPGNTIADFIQLKKLEKLEGQDSESPPPISQQTPTSINEGERERQSFNSSDLGGLTLEQLQSLAR